MFAPEKVTTTIADCPGDNLPRFCGNGVAFVVGDASVPSVNMTLLATAPPMFWTVTPTTMSPQLLRTNGVTVTTSFGV